MEPYPMLKDLYLEAALHWVAKSLNQKSFLRRMEASLDWNYLLECLEQSSLTECIDGDIDEGVSGLDQEELAELITKWLERGRFTELRDTILGQNLETLAQQIGLSDDEVSVFGFLILCQQQFLLSIVVTRYGKLNWTSQPSLDTL